MRQASEWSRKQDEGGARFERERIIEKILKGWPWLLDEEVIALINGDDK
jgi:hypothetical protein